MLGTRVFWALQNPLSVYKDNFGVKDTYLYNKYLFEH